MNGKLQRTTVDCQARERSGSGPIQLTRYQRCWALLRKEQLQHIQRAGLKPSRSFAAICSQTRKPEAGAGFGLPGRCPAGLSQGNTSALGGPQSKLTASTERRRWKRVDERREQPDLERLRFLPTHAQRGISAVGVRHRCQPSKLQLESSGPHGDGR